MTRLLGPLLLWTAAGAAPELVALLSATAAGGRVDLEATRLTPQSVKAFTRPLTDEGLVAEVLAEVEAARSSGAVYGAVVAVVRVPTG